MIVNGKYVYNPLFWFFVFYNGKYGDKNPTGGLGCENITI